MNLKTLNENRGAKAKEARALIDKAHAEKRSLTDTENNTLNGLQTDVEKIDAQIMAEVRQFAIEGQRLPDLSAGDKRDLAGFDLGVVLRSLVNNDRLEGVEGEVVAEGRKEAAASGLSYRGVMLPRMLVRRAPERRDMTATGGSGGDQGGMTIATNKVGLADDFYNASVLRGIGATVLSGLTGNVDLPRLDAGTAPAKKAENAASDEVSPTTAMLSLSPKRLPAFIDLSEQLLRQSSAAIQAIVSKSLTAQMLAVQELAFINGGGTNEANGILGTSGIGSVAGGANGLAPTWAHMVALETALDTTNSLAGQIRYLTNGAVRGKLKTTIRNPSGTDSTYILDDRAQGMLNGYGTAFTNAVPRTLTKGSSSGVCSAIILGNWTDYIVAEWSGISLELLRDVTNAKSGLYTLVASTYYDGGVLRPKSFAAMQDALTA